MRAGDLDTSSVEGAAASAMCDAEVLPGDYPDADGSRPQLSRPTRRHTARGSFAEARDAFIRACGVTSL